MSATGDGFFAGATGAIFLRVWNQGNISGQILVFVTSVWDRPMGGTDLRKLQAGLEDRAHRSN